VTELSEELIAESGRSRKNRRRRQKNKPPRVQKPLVESYPPKQKKIYKPNVPKTKRTVRWKWSFDGDKGKLQIWPTDEWGDPPHIQVTGPDYYKFAQGRIYVDGDGPRDSIAPNEKVDVMIWQDRGSSDWQKRALATVNQWLKIHFNHQADHVSYRSEYGYWNTVDKSITDDVKDAVDRDYATFDQQGAEDAYTSDHALLGKEPHAEYIKNLVNSPHPHIYTDPDSWDAKELQGSKFYIWAYDYGTGEFSARQVHTADPQDDDFSKAFGDDGLWSAQGEIVFDNNKTIMTIHHTKPYAFEKSPTDLEMIQSKARDAGIKWIKTILGKNIDLVKWANEAE
jgi:hypothetical protein